MQVGFADDFLTHIYERFFYPTASNIRDSLPSLRRYGSSIMSMKRTFSQDLAINMLETILFPFLTGWSPTSYPERGNAVRQQESHLGNQFRDVRR